MPQRRIQVESGIPTGSLTTPARPVDTFVQPTDGVKLEQLAQGLSQLAPGLEHLSDAMAKRSAETQFAAGEIHARKLSESAASFREAVQNGSISPHQSPWFMAGLKEQFGRLAADRMNFEFQTAAVQDAGLQTTTDPADFDKFYTDFRNKWMQSNLDPKSRDAYFEKGFGHKADAYLADNQRTFASQLSGRVVKFAGDGHFSEVMNNVMVEYGRGTPMTTIGTALSQLNDLAVGRGMGGNLVNQMTVDAVVAAARRQNDPSILDILDHVQSGKADLSGNRPSLSTTRYGAAKVEEAQHDIAAEVQNRNNRDYSEHQRLQSRAVESVVQNTWTMLDQTNGHGDLTVLRGQMNAVAPEKVALLYQMQDAYNDHTIKDDPPQVASAFRRVNVIGSGESYTTLEEAASLLANRNISIPSYRNLVNDIQEREKVGPSRWASDAVLKSGVSDMERMFGVEFGQTGDNPNATRLALEAKDEFTMRYIRWRQGPGAGVDDATTWLNRTRNDIFARMTNRSAATDYSRIPHANLGPSLPDPAKQLVSDPSNINTLSNELDRWVTNGRNQLSPLSLDLLKRYGIPAEPSAIKKFVMQQRSFLQSPLPAPATNTSQQ